MNLDDFKKAVVDQGLVKQNNLEMPKEYYGEMKKNNGFTKSNPRNWTEKEIEWCLKKREEGFPIHAIAASIGRTRESVAIKLKRISKDKDEYNKPHVEDKYKHNSIFYDLVKPKTILDLYAGSCYWSKLHGTGNVLTNDKDKTMDTDYHADALKLLCHLYYSEMNYDLIDLDPYGSAFDCFDLAIKMANKAIIITFGELGHKRFKRLDFVRDRYNIEKIEDFTLDLMVNKVLALGRMNKKLLIPIFKKQWKGIARVYFMITEYKQTEQWGTRNKGEEEE